MTRERQERLERARAEIARIMSRDGRKRKRNSTARDTGADASQLVKSQPVDAGE